ncbi:MAG: hypothetical protein HYR56_16175 [Acidobacteria bacterium]|nr:hypothetical protein [Acidobacteriota bacterium]MBI3421767.1 hypothetical protein [Acidobacteriota bacterium]
MESCPLHAQHQAEMTKQASHDHLAEVNQRGAQAMGFSQTKTTHHFRLYADGGAIEVTARRAKDVASRRQIRQHLQQIAQLFASGDFSKPQHTHAQVPPGVAEMTQLRTDIVYQFEPLPRGGRVRIKTANPDALKAVHEFLRFQITDHQTGDAVAVMP